VNGTVRYVGQVGTGFPERLRERLNEVAPRSHSCAGRRFWSASSRRMLLPWLRQPGVLRVDMLSKAFQRTEELAAAFSAEDNNATRLVLALIACVHGSAPGWAPGESGSHRWGPGSMRNGQAPSWRCGKALSPCDIGHLWAACHNSVKESLTSREQISSRRSARHAACTIVLTHTTFVHGSVIR
jgi:hypothetical protein